jgi:hypothetical protein
MWNLRATTPSRAGGCGTDYNGFAIVDSVSGRVYDGFSVHELPFDWVKDHVGDTIKRREFHPNSRLLKINGCPNEANCGLYDYVMVDGRGLKLIQNEFLPEDFQPLVPSCPQKNEVYLTAGQFLSFTSTQSGGVLSRIFKLTANVTPFAYVLTSEIGR